MEFGKIVLLRIKNSGLRFERLKHIKDYNYPALSELIVVEVMLPRAALRLPWAIIFMPLQDDKTVWSAKLHHLTIAEWYFYGSQKANDGTYGTNRWME
jgi:hypothetical protein